MRCRLVIGSYGSVDHAGIQIVDLDTETGRFSTVHEQAGAEAPSYLCLGEKRRRLFAVSERPSDGELLAFALDADRGELREIARRKTGGAHPCFVTTDVSGGWLLGVNYMSGSIFVFATDPRLGIGELTSFEQLHGKGVRPDRQEGPHPHSIFNIPKTELWMVPDLGTDRIMVYRLTGEGRLVAKAEFAATPGAGPRHVAFHPRLPVAYVVQELASTIAVLRYEAETGRLERIEPDATTLPEGFSGSSDAAGIQISPSGDLLYASNRGDDSIATFRVSGDGSILPIAHTPTGRTPRSVLLVPETGALLVAAQDEECVQLFERLDNGVPGRVRGLHHIHQPACIATV